MSAESGVPTFRDAQTGLWSRFKPEELATPGAFARDPRHVWAWYRQRRAALKLLEPHAGHRVLAEWERRLPRMVVITQNVDGLHHRAGSRNVIELHGRLDVARCTACPYEIAGLDDLGEDPHCPLCRQWLRPGVVWFGEFLPSAALHAAQQAALECDVFLVIGTSGVVQPAAGLAEYAAGREACVIEINPERTPLSHLADVCVRGGCGEVLTAIDGWRSGNDP